MRRRLDLKLVKSVSMKRQKMRFCFYSQNTSAKISKGEDETFAGRIVIQGHASTSNGVTDNLRVGRV